MIIQIRKVVNLAFIGIIFVLSTAQPVCAKSSKGEIIHQQVIAATPIYANRKVSDFVSEVGQKLVEANDLTDHEYQFFVLDDPNINAFTPGYGYIYMNRGLLSFLTSEAELAGVLAHEIAHNTERHLSRKKSGLIWSNIAAYAAAIAVGNGNIYDVVQQTATVRLQGFGREMELEADEAGALYMYNANYDPASMLGVLSTLKDHERFRDLQSIEEGGDATYHGVFASHPRSDKRLQEVIQKAGTLPPGESFQGREEMRAVLESMVVGKNYKSNQVDGYERFINKSLGITMLYPEDWSKSVSGAKIIFKDAAQTIQLKLTVEKTADDDKTKTSKELLLDKYPDDLKQVSAIRNDPSLDLGTTARYNQERVAVVTVGRNSFYFQGIAKNNQLTEEQDKIFQTIIASFRRLESNDTAAKEVARIYYKRLEPGETFAELAANKVMGPYTEQQLRLMNGYYPNGEAEPGTWIKLVKIEPVEE